MWKISSLQKRSSVLLVLVGALLAAPSTALAASDVHLAHAADGTLVVVGSGWPRGQALVISLGPQRFNVRADGSGDFELTTGLASFRGELAVHHADRSVLAFVGLPAADLTHVSPLAVDVAQCLVEGLALLGVGLAAGLLPAAAVRRRRASRYPRE